jgi:hypothetical protein
VEQLTGAAVDAQVVEAHVDPGQRAGRQLGGTQHCTLGLDQDAQADAAGDQVEGAVDLLGRAHHRQQDLVGATVDRLVDLAGGPGTEPVDPAEQPARRGRAHPGQVLGGVGVDLRALAELPPFLAAPLPVHDDAGRARGHDVGAPTGVHGEEEEVHAAQLRLS